MASATRAFRQGAEKSGNPFLIGQGQAQELWKNGQRVYSKIAMLAFSNNYGIIGTNGSLCQQFSQLAPFSVPNGSVFFFSEKADLCTGLSAEGFQLSALLLSTTPPTLTTSMSRARLWLALLYGRVFLGCVMAVTNNYAVQFVASTLANALTDSQNNPNVLVYVN